MTSQPPPAEPPWDTSRIREAVHDPDLDGRFLTDLYRAGAEGRALVMAKWEGIGRQIEAGIERAGTRLFEVAPDGGARAGLLITERVCLVLLVTHGDEAVRVVTIVPLS